MSLIRSLGLVLLVIASPLQASVRKHAVKPLAAVTVSGVVRDAAGNAVGGAIVSSGSSFSNRNGTGADGKYSLKLPANRPTMLLVEDFAFDSQTINFTPPATDGTLDITLTRPRPALTVKLTSGETHVLDLGTSQFAYMIPLSGYARSDTANFCKPDGSAFAPAKTEIARIIGPGTSVTYAPCCSNNQTILVNVEMKSGEKTPAYFNDACAGSEVDFIGREPSTGLWQYMRFTDIAEIDFP